MFSYFSGMSATVVPLALPWRSRVTRRHSQPSEKDGAHARPPMLPAGASMDTCHFYRPGGLLVVLRLRGGALYM